MRKPCGLMVLRSVFALGVVLGVVAHGVKVARIVGDGVAVGVRHDSVLAWLIMARGCQDRDGCAHLHGLKLAMVLVCVRALHHTHIYIIGKTKYFNEKTKNYLFLFGNIKISL